jgi:hypothetical protein
MITLPDGRSFCPCGCPHCMVHPARVLGLSLDEALRLATRKSLVIDFTDPANAGGKWLRKPRKRNPKK